MCLESGAARRQRMGEIEGVVALLWLVDEVAGFDGCVDRIRGLVVVQRVTNLWRGYSFRRINGYFSRGWVRHVSFIHS